MLFRSAKAFYESLSGWDADISGVRELADLPAAARDYLKRLEDLSEVSPAMVSVGADREATIMLKNPFEPV